MKETAMEPQDAQGDSVLYQLTITASGTVAQGTAPDEGEPA